MYNVYCITYGNRICVRNFGQTIITHKLLMTCTLCLPIPIILHTLPNLLKIYLFLPFVLNLNCILYIVLKTVIIKISCLNI